jgi:uncharacterized membrane protein
MTATDFSAPAGTRSSAALAARAIATLLVAFLAWEMVHFFLRDPWHYIADYTPKSFDRFWSHRFVLLPHIAGGTIALFTGPFQLWSGLRRRNLSVHRATGYAYIAGIFLAGGTAFYLALFAMPRFSGIPLFAMATAWWTTVAMAFVAIRRKQIDAHRQWMIRGYVITFAFVTFRYIADLPVFAPLGDERFMVVGWMCWTIPLFITEVALQWRRTLGPAKRRVPLQS